MRCTTGLRAPYVLVIAGLPKPETCKIQSDLLFVAHVFSVFKGEPLKSSRFYRSVFWLFFFFVFELSSVVCSMMSICLLTEVKQQWSKLILGWVTI